MTNLDHITFRDMTVTDGMKSAETVSTEQQIRAAAIFVEPLPARTGWLQTLLEHHGVREQASFRAADRLLQKLRKAGVIRWNGKVWERVG